KTWSACSLPVEPNSVVYWLATHPANPDVVVANSLHGYVYSSTDGGESWKKNRREFGEIRAIAWTPN
ncbi:MAG: glycosyl hydrolase, partial [Candidatus Binataceae bacterium]